MSFYRNFVCSPSTPLYFNDAACLCGADKAKSNSNPMSVSKIFSKKSSSEYSRFCDFIVFFYVKKERKYINSHQLQFLTLFAPLRPCSSMMPPAFVVPTKPKPMVTTASTVVEPSPVRAGTS